MYCLRIIAVNKSAFLNERDSWCAIFLIVRGERTMFIFIRTIVLIICIVSIKGKVEFLPLSILFLSNISPGKFKFVL